MNSLDDNVAFIDIPRPLKVTHVSTASMMGHPLELRAGRYRTLNIMVRRDDGLPAIHLELRQHQQRDGRRTQESEFFECRPETGYLFAGTFSDGLRRHGQHRADEFVGELFGYENGIMMPIAEYRGERHGRRTEVAVAAKGAHQFEELIRYFENLGGQVVSTTHQPR